MNKIKVLNEDDIKKIINMDIAIKAVEKAYMQKNSNKGNVWPLVFYEYEHNVFDLDIRSGNLDNDNVYGLKLISYNENNPNNNMPKVFATSLIFDSKSGKPLALLNASPITSYRTGASAAIGAKFLAREDSENLLVVGCGNIAIYSIVATLITMPNIKNVCICNPKNYENLSNKDVEETEIESIGLEISDDNEPSKRIATKNGFKKAGERFFSLTLEDYIKQRENTIRD